MAQRDRVAQMIDSPKYNRLSRRALLAGVPWLVAGCASSNRFEWPATAISGYGQYGALTDGAITIPAIDMTTVDPALLRQEVAWHGPQRPGSIVVASISSRRTDGPCVTQSASAAKKL